MKSAMIVAFTEDPHDIRVVNVPVPTPGRGQVRVRMLLSPVHPADLNYLRGTYYRALERVIWNQRRSGTAPEVFFDAARTIPCPAPPYGLGLEGVGVVEDCGPGFLARRLLGRRVVVAAGPPNGTWGEQVVVNARRAIALPADVPDEQGAVFLANPLSAYAMVHDVLRVWCAPTRMPRNWPRSVPTRSSILRARTSSARWRGSPTARACLLRSTASAANWRRHVPAGARRGGRRRRDGTGPYRSRVLPREQRGPLPGHHVWRSNCWNSPMTTAAHIMMAAISMFSPSSRRRSDAMRILGVRCCSDAKGCRPPQPGATSRVPRAADRARPAPVRAAVRRAGDQGCEPSMPPVQRDG